MDQGYDITQDDDRDDGPGPGRDDDRPGLELRHGEGEREVLPREGFLQLWPEKQGLSGC